MKNLTKKTLIAACLFGVALTSTAMATGPVPVPKISRSFNAEDKYAACLIGRGIIKRHQGMPIGEAMAAAYQSCGRGPASLDQGDGGDGEGLSDFVNKVVGDYREDSTR